MRVFVISTLLLLGFAVNANVVRYEFDVDYKTTNVGGQAVKALAIGGSIPAPTITATVGDILEVTFHNKLDVETSIHWHGLLLPNNQDGVPYLTTLPIYANTSFTYRFPITHHGTYWYHSHTGLQEQRGIYGALVFYPQEETIPSDHDYVVMLSDWTNENPDQVLANLKKNGHYYTMKRNSVQSWNKVIAHGLAAIKNRLTASWIRMGPMDIADVGYDMFLTNGNHVTHFDVPKPGEKVRLRIINGSASSYFHLTFSGGPMTIVTADGVDVEPLPVQRLRIAIAETYDLVLTVPENQSYELRATVDDASGYTSVILGQGDLVPAPDMPKPNLYTMMHHRGFAGMDHDRHKKAKQMSKAMPATKHKHDQQAEQKLMVQDVFDQYQNLRAKQVTTLDPNRPMREIHLSLTGDMERYIWSFDNKTLTEADHIMIRKGENIRLVLENTSMMNHPLHLHGHFFRVLNGQDEYSPLKHTVNVPPMDTVRIEFSANEDKDWFFHCHNLYHMKTGMARVVRYQGTKPNPELIAAKKASTVSDDNAGFGKTKVGIYNNKAEIFTRLSNTRNAVELAIEYNFDKTREAEILYERSFTRFFSIVAGLEYEKEENKSESEVVLGIRYVLPLMIHFDLQLDSGGSGEIELKSELDLTTRTQFKWEWKTDGEYDFGLNYLINSKWAIGVNYGKDYDAGLGMVAKF